MLLCDWKEWIIVANAHESHQKWKEWFSEYYLVMCPTCTNKCFNE